MVMIIYLETWIDIFLFGAMACCWDLGLSLFEKLKLDAVKRTVKSISFVQVPRFYDSYLRGLKAG
jgi:hypothetical protein